MILSAAIKKEAVAAIGAGDYARAEGLLRRAFDADLAAARREQDIAHRVQEITNRRLLTAAKTRADLAAEPGSTALRRRGGRIQEAAVWCRRGKHWFDRDT